MAKHDPDLEVRADGVGRRGEVGRRGFVRAGVIGAAMSSALVMKTDPALGAAQMARRTTSTAAKAAGLVKKGPELALPPGFKYHTFGAFGSAMSDGFITPPIHDGMGCFDMGNGKLRLVRNHELGEGNDIAAGTVIGDPKTAYDRKAPGGTVTLEVDADTGELLGDWISLNGTDTNCAGVPTPWGTWLTCEETVVGPKSGYKKPHGYVFEVDPANNKPVLTSPYKKLGRFLHEAGAVDPETGVIYLTEDEGPDGFYRFVPDSPGHLRKGVLQMLRVRGEPRYNTITGQTVGEVLKADWVTTRTPGRPRTTRRRSSSRAGPRVPRSSSAARAAPCARARSCSARARVATWVVDRSGSTPRPRTSARSTSAATSSCSSSPRTRASSTAPTTCAPAPTGRSSSPRTATWSTTSSAHCCRTER
jgi:hypothetical protein